MHGSPARNSRPCDDGNVRKVTIPAGAVAAMARMNGKRQMTSPIPCLACMTTVDATCLRLMQIVTLVAFYASRHGPATADPGPCGRFRRRADSTAGQFHLDGSCSSIVPPREDQPMPNPRSARPSRRGVLAGAAAASAILAAPALVRAQASALKIAVLLPRSGYLAPSGQSCHRGALIAPQ